MPEINCPGCGKLTNTVFLSDALHPEYCYLYADDDGTWHRGCIPADPKLQNPYFAYAANRTLGSKWGK